MSLSAAGNIGVLTGTIAGSFGAATAGTNARPLNPSVVEAAINKVKTALSQLGTAVNQITTQTNFVKSLTDSLAGGVSQLAKLGRSASTSRKAAAASSTSPCASKRLPRPKLNSGSAPVGSRATALGRIGEMARVGEASGMVAPKWRGSDAGAKLCSAATVLGGAIATIL